MGSDVRILWLAANGDPSKISDEGMREHAKVVDALRDAGLAYAYPNPVIACDGLDISFTTIITGPLGTASVSALAVAVGAFLQARLGRKVRIKVGEIEVEASSAAEVECLLEKALEIRNRLKDGADE